MPQRLATLLLYACICGPALAVPQALAGPPTPEAIEFFEKEVRPLLVEHCLKGHGGGIKGGIVHGATDDFGWHAVHDKVHVHDLHATILHLMGIDHERLTYRHAGRDYRLTDVFGKVVRPILA